MRRVAEYHRQILLGGTSFVEQFLGCHPRLPLFSTDLTPFLGEATEFFALDNGVDTKIGEGVQFPKPYPFLDGRLRDQIPGRLFALAIPIPEIDCLAKVKFIVAATRVLSSSFYQDRYLRRIQLHSIDEAELKRRLDP